MKVITKGYCKDCNCEKGMKYVPFSLILGRCIPYLIINGFKILAIYTIISFVLFSYNIINNLWYVFTPISIPVIVMFIIGLVYDFIKWINK